MAPRLLPRCWAGLQRVTATTTALTMAEAASTTTSIATHTTTPVLSGRVVEGRRGVKYGWSTLPRRGAKPTRFNQQTAGLPAPTTGPAAALKRKENTTPLRTGVLATKRGMTGFYSKSGTRIPCTVLELDSVQVVANKTRTKNGYWAVQIGSGTRRAATVTAPQLGYYEAKGIAPKQHLAEFPVRNASGLLQPGVTIQPDWFHVGQWVDVRSNTRGFGFAGGMKRHGFKGQNKTHGNSLNHRTMGTTGPSQGSGSRVMPGKKMPGRMGNERVTVQNLNILQVDNDLGIVVVKGAVGGPKGALVKIQDAVKKPPPATAFIEKTRVQVEERSPWAAEQLEAARVRHLELKEARREGRIAELLSKGFSDLSIEEGIAVEDSGDVEVETEFEAPIPEAVLDTPAEAPQPRA
ncbi:60S ribosomal protein L3, mitochondrial precursor [Sporothrix brasiliensis 5110]|uniref:Large ribosomal subunit protein uL3m n=1 Tax=Sporothrix brasiliensis 5110 TaxID=1398154 RepID=A0A0C2IR46_9PEZI|nr:60S ribosomal protein L3, mitochondrial precursor [Sporothrix brasiliensis 5110]KIH91486.1 60S ribosomal protein L3, mitochondrial precursor [Sporothrix brasiliensis 5110]